ncbi:hypothetical protein CASFOL_042450 [Castilleja foliolosa]|uniref:F-box domain-containing protein n=1 Tax=Castilleja foliolosa TaxID=1961234 RepID=A0ABD3BAG1_9LAMI
MKLRLESKETLIIEVPNPCTLSQLKQTIVQSFLNSPSPDSIRLSLNRKDELQSNGGDSLHSHGIAAGDLIYFSLEQPVAAPMSPNPQNTLPQITPDFAMVSEMDENIEEMEVDNEDNIEIDVAVGKSFSVPGFLKKVAMAELGFLRKVSMAELGHGAGKNLRLIVIGIHMVMLETGFVCFDKKANIVADGFTFLKKWSSSPFNVSLCYTLQESLSSCVIKSVVLKFQTLGKFINVYSTLESGPGKKSSTHRVQLDEDQMVPFLTAVLANCVGETGVILGNLEKKVFEFWRTVKDSIVLPLLIDLCEEIGLQLPPCFMRLPTDLKMRILESLPGTDVARASCVCSELRHLGSSNNLWKMKYAEVFGDTKKHEEGIWKTRFARDWESLMFWKDSRKGSRASAAPYGLEPYRGVDPYLARRRSVLNRRRYPNPIMVPQVPRRSLFMCRKGRELSHNFRTH